MIKGNAPNTIEFHWYSAEEGGLLGSQAIFSEYEKQGRDVKAMLQQDMTGFIQKTIDSGKPESVGVITDYVDSSLTTFIVSKSQSPVLCPGYFGGVQTSSRARIILQRLYTVLKTWTTCKIAITDPECGITEEGH